MKAFVSWSGGKDSALACYRAINFLNIDVLYLLCMLSEKGNYSRSHGLSTNLLLSQAEALNIPLVRRAASWKNYEVEFKKGVSDLKEHGIEAAIFGDIDVEEHRCWVERVCKESGITPVLPLWKEDRMNIMDELIHLGFRSMVVVTQISLLGKKWLGCKINRKFIERLSDLKEIDLCGENGEYHTFVYDGPIFKKRINVQESEPLKKGKYWILNITLHSLEINT